MNVLVLGDPHCSEKIFKMDYSYVDLILIPGDLGEIKTIREGTYKFGFSTTEWIKHSSKREVERGFKEQIETTEKMLKFLSTKAPVFWVEGNVEYGTDQKIRMYKINVPNLKKKSNIKNVKNISFRKINFRHLIIAGCPMHFDSIWTRNFRKYNKEKREVALKEDKRVKSFLKKIGKVDILLCHQPPLGYLDVVYSKYVPKKWKGGHAGSPWILNYINKYQPRYVFCGHIHESRGKKRVGKTLVVNVGHEGDFCKLKI